MMNVVIYARYSSDHQTEQSIEGQIAVCKEYAEQNGYTVIDTYIDRAMTATTDKRPEFLRMIADSKKRLFEGVLVYQFDRFARNRHDSVVYKHELKKNGVRVFSAKEHITEDAMGIFMEGVLESYGEYFSVELSQKVKRGHQINAEKAKSNGGTTPFGFLLENGELKIDESKGIYVKKIFEMYANGSRIVDIVDYLNDMNVKTTKGRPFNRNSLHTILKNKKYTGVYKYGDTEVPGGVPRIISDELFEKVQKVLLRNKQNAGHNKAKHEYILTTKLFCGHCNSMMSGVSAYSSKGTPYAYYSCKKARVEKKCDMKNKRKDKLEDVVVRECRKLLTDDNIEMIANAVADISKEIQNSLTIKQLKKNLSACETAIENLLKALETGENMDIISERLTLKRKELTAIEKELTLEKKKNMPLSDSEIRFFLNELKKGKINDPKYRKTLVNIFINKIYVYDDRLRIILNVSNTPVTVSDVLLDEISEAEGDMGSSYIAGNVVPTKTAV